MQPRYSCGRLIRAGLLALGLTAWTATPAAAINVVLDYTHDTFFSSHPTAKAALEAAAQDISNVILTSLNPTVDPVQGQAGTATATFDWQLQYRNPATGAFVTFDPVELPADEVRIFVGVRNLTGDTLGQGGPQAAASVNISVSYFNESDIPGAITQGAAQSSTNLGRGGGPIMGTIDDNFDGTSPYSVTFGAMLGNLWFDVDTDNNGSTDSSTTLNNFWHFDHTTDVAEDKYDFYSVALHELLHALGIGTSQAWDDLANGNNWLGSNAIAMHGTGNNLVSGGHIAEGILSTDIVNGDTQEVAMDPTLTKGQRKYLTELDLAFLADIGWNVAIPEPTAAGLMTLSLLLTLRQRRTRPQA